MKRSLKYIKKGTIFDMFNYLFMVLFALSIVFPFWNILLLSFADDKVATSLGFHLWNSKWNLESYKFILSTSNLIQAYFNTIFRTVVGTTFTLIMSFLAAFSLSKKNLPARNIITIYFIIPMFFGGGMIPYYLQIKSLGLINNIWVLIIPTMFATYSMLIVRNFLMAMDKELEDAAFIDGANYLDIMVKIMIPLSKPVLATIALWSMIGHWNSWFDAMIFTSSENLLVLQTFLRRLIDMNRVDLNALEAFDRLKEIRIHTATIKAATIIVTIGPIIVSYPFLQKYFVKGIMVGSLKG